MICGTCVHNRPRREKWCPQYRTRNYFLIWLYPIRKKSTISPQPLGRFSRPWDRSKGLQKPHLLSTRSRLGDEVPIAFYGNFTKERAIAPEPLRASSRDHARWKALAKAHQNELGTSPNGRFSDFEFGGPLPLRLECGILFLGQVVSLPSRASPAVSNGQRLATVGATVW